MEVLKYGNNNNIFMLLLFNTYIYYGIAYEEGIHDYLKSSDEDKDKYGTNALNDIFNAHP